MRTPRLPSDHLVLTIVSFDQTYQRRISCTCCIQVPEETLEQPVLESYLDDAYTVFDPLLDNDLILKLSYSYQDTRFVLERSRIGNAATCTPFSYRLRISLRTVRGQPMAVTFSSFRPVFPSGYTTERRHFLRDTPIPELRVLFTFIQRPDFPWLTSYGERVERIERAVFSKRKPR